LHFPSLRVSIGTYAAPRRTLNEENALSPAFSLTSPLLTMSTVKFYLNALLALSADEQLAVPRRHLLQSINDDDLSELLKRLMGRDFARGAVEDIVLVILDIIARDPNSINDQDTSGTVVNAKVEDIGNESDGLLGNLHGIQLVNMN
jgi:hypothetical protein